MHTLTSFFDWLLTASLRASALTVGVCFVQFLLQKHLSPRWRYALWLPVLVVLLMPVLPESRWSAEQVFVWEKPALIVPPVSVIADATASTMPTTATTPPRPAFTIDWSRVRVLTWAGGTLLVLLIGGASFARTLFRVRRSRQGISDDLATRLDEVSREVGLRHKPRLVMSPQVTSPAVTGLLRPLLLLPPGFEQNFTAEEKQLILHHELMHLKRGDLPLNTLLCVLLALHWFNPLLWLAFFKVRADREAACDAQVLENATPQRRSAYGHALLKIESAFAPLRLSLGFIGILQRHASLRARIRSIAAPTRTRPLTGLVVTACMLAMTFLGVTRAEKPAKPANAVGGTPDGPLVALEVRTLRFKQNTSWDFGGRMKLVEPQQQPKSAEVGITLLSAQDLQSFLREVRKQPGADLTTWPRMVTQDGKEVQIRSVVNQPVPDGKKENGEYRITYLPIGYVAKFTPKSLLHRRLSLEIDLTDSKIIDTTIKDGQEYPVAQSRVYRSSVEFEEGLTVVQYDWEGHDWKDGKFQTYRPVLNILTAKRLEAGANQDAAFFLRTAKPQQYDFAKANLGDVLRFLATDAGIRFISVPEDHAASKKLVTFSIKDSPFSVLETICKANGLMLVLDRDVWHIRPSDDAELRSRSYPLLNTKAKPADVSEALQKLIKAPATVKFDEKSEVFHINATRLQHTWVDAYFQGLHGKQ